MNVIYAYWSELSAPVIPALSPVIPVLSLVIPVLSLVIPVLSLVIPVLSLVIPAKAGIQGLRAPRVAAGLFASLTLRTDFQSFNALRAFVPLLREWRNLADLSF